MLRARGEFSHHLAFLDNWLTIIRAFLVLPHVAIGWVFLQGNENMGSVQDFILFHLKNLLGGVAFVIIYIASSKSWSTRGDLTSLVSWIAARLLIARAWPIYLVDELVLGVLWKSRTWNSVKHQRQSYCSKVCGAPLDEVNNKCNRVKGRRWK